MCGRYASFRSDHELARYFAVQQMLADARPSSWNVAPTTPVRVVLERVEDGEAVRQLRTARWGLVPSWAKDPSVGARMINARVETVLDKPSYRKAATVRRAIVPMDGYYEWRVTPTGKVPHYLTAPDGGEVLAAAGLYELWRDHSKPDDDEPGAWLWSVTIITTAAADTLGHIHDRSPLILPADLWDDWLDPTTTDPSRVRELLAAVPEPHLTPRVVSAAVGSVRNNGPELIEPT